MPPGLHCNASDVSWVLDYYLYGAPEGYYWYHYDNIEKASAGFSETDKNRINYLMFYADNNKIINEFAPYIHKNGISYIQEYSVFNKFGRENIILYRIVKEESKQQE